MSIASPVAKSFFSRFSSLLLPRLLIVFLLLPSIAFSKASEQTDVRLLIDISGSMKKNDPNNLRIPAVNLLTEIVPNGSKAGVWTFGQYINNLVKYGQVDDAWRRVAKEKAKEINSVALLTNIGGVLEKSSDDFYKDVNFNNTHFILLTDGMVDIDRDPDKNEKERQRILSDIVKKFKDKGAHIHTIALSDNADKTLLDKLAVETEGHSEVALSSEELSKIFLKTFDQAVPAEQVPLVGNGFNIDSSIEEFTALVFRKEGSQPTKLRGPDEKIYSATDTDEYLKWYQDKGYDLITVKRPLEGEWILEADLLPDSRVTVVSNLQMNVTRLPPYFYAGDVLNVDVSFLEDGKPLVNPDFLSLLDIKLNLRTEDNKSGTKTISDPSNLPKDGVFSDTISKLKKEGQYEVNVLVDGKTFQRKNRQIITLRSPIDVELAATGEGESTAYTLTITPRNKKIDLSKTSVATKIKAPDASTTFKNVPFNQETMRWQMQIDPLKGEGNYQVALRVKGETSEGNEFAFSPPIFDAVFPREGAGSGQYVAIKEAPEEEAPPETDISPVIEPPIEVPETIEPVVEEANVEEPVEETAVAEEPVITESPEEGGLSDITKWSIIGGASLATLLLLFGGIYFWKKKKNKVVDEENAEDGDSGEATSVRFDEPEDVPVVAEPEVEEPEVEESLDFVEEPVIDVPEEELPIDDAFDEVDLGDIQEDSIEEDAIDIDDFMSEDLMDEEEVEEVPPVLEEQEALLDEVVSDEDIAKVLDGESFDEVEDISEDLPADEDVNDVNIDDLIEDVVDGKTADEVVEDILADNDDLDEEFNLEDFDIADTSDLDLQDDDLDKKKDE